MIAIRYTIKLLEPLLATALQSDPNSAVSYPYIPGSLIRGALIGNYLVNPKEKYFAVKRESRQRFLNGETRYLNNYLLDNDGNRTLPTPLSWYKEKGVKLEKRTDRYPIFNKAHPDFEDEDFQKIDQPKPQEAQFCMVAPDDTVTLYANPERQINIHTRREDRSAGRATDDEKGAVFRYDALAAGQSFGGVILCDNPVDVDALVKQLTNAEFVIGGSRSGGYGRVRVTNVEQTKNWDETETVSADILANEILTITLLSDTIMRDDNGQFADTLSAKTLAKALSVAETALTAVKAYRKTETVGGFNRKWGLPLPQNLAIRAGSVFSFHTTTNISAAAIKALQWRGLGQRRTEGFGRFAVNWIDSEEFTVTKPSDEKLKLSKPTLNAESQKLAQQMSERLFRSNANQSLVEKADRITINKAPKRSQLGSLRVEIRQAMQTGNIQGVIIYLNNMKPTAGKQFETARIGGDTLKEWLMARLQNPGNIWRQQLGNPDTDPLHLGAINTSSALAAEYTLRFVDAVVAKASKKEGNNG